MGERPGDGMHFAEFGVVMMRFLVGLELQPAPRWQMRSRLLGLGGLPVAVTARAIAAIPVFALLLFAINDRLVQPRFARAPKAARGGDDRTAGQSGDHRRVRPLRPHRGAISGSTCCANWACPRRGRGRTAAAV